MTIETTALCPACVGPRSYRRWTQTVAAALAVFQFLACSGNGEKGDGTSVQGAVDAGGTGNPGSGMDTGTSGGTGANPGDSTSAMGGTVPTGVSGLTGADSTGAPAFDDGCGAVSQMAENTLQPVDIIFGIDTSGSMAEEVAEVQENLNAFSQQIIAAGIDVHVIMVASPKGGSGSGGIAVDGPCIAPPLGSGNCPNDSNPPAYVHIDQAVTSWDVLDVFVNAYPGYREHLRENSLKTFVAISDDDATAENNPAGILVSGIFGSGANGLSPVPTINTADKFIDAVANLEPDSSMWNTWRYSSIFSFSPTCPSAAVGGAEGKVHRELVERTGGVGGDLCLQDFAPVFDQLATRVAETVTLACDWAIPPPPDGESFDADKTNVQVTLDGAAEGLPKVPVGQPCDDRGGWHYDDDANPTRVVACPASCTRIQSVGSSAKVDLLFGCATIVVPLL